MIARHPSDPDNAAPDWMCVSRGRFTEPKSQTWDERSAEARKVQTEKKRVARQNLRAEGYLPLGEWSRAHGVEYSTAVKRCMAGTLAHVVVMRNYWIAPEAVA